MVCGAGIVEKRGIRSGALPHRGARDDGVFVHRPAGGKRE